MDYKKRIVFATNNAHKLEEARRILGDELEIVSLAEIGCHDDIPETAETLEGNALIKARWVKERYGYDCFSDDTGLMVDALDGAPGVYSARYAGEDCTPADNVHKLLAEMHDKDIRSAHFATVVALVKDGKEHCFEGRVDGSIAREAHGNGGFGYDPIFIAGETGKCFAEMTPEDKNAISHRGRALRKLRDFLRTLALVAVLVIGMPAAAQQWRLHSAYDGQMTRIIDAKNFTYFLGVSQKYDPNNKKSNNHYGLLIRYDKTAEEYEILDSQNMLSGNIVTAVEYSEVGKFLVIAYEDGNIDILYDNGDVYNIPGLKMADASLPKVVNSICIGDDGVPYLATDFGYLTINVKQKQIEASKVFNTPVYAAMMHKGKVWIATDNKILCGDPSAFKLDDFVEIASVDRVERIFPLGNKGIVVMHGKINNYQCSLITDNGNRFETKTLQASGCRGMEKMENGLLLSLGNRVRILPADSDGEVINLPDGGFNRLISSYNGKDFWCSDARKGISLMAISSDRKQWTLKQENWFPNVSSAFFCSAMAYSPQYGVLVRNHGMDHNFNDSKSNYFGTNDLVSAYKDMTWKRISATYLSDSKGLTVIDPNGMAIDPINPDHLYGGSLYSGILRLDLSDVNKSLRFGMPSDMSGGYGQLGFVPLVDDPEPGADWPERCFFSAPRFDAYGNLLTMHVRPTKENGGVADIELWYWTPQDRQATTSPSNARKMKVIKLEGDPISMNPTMMPLKTEANKNIIVMHGNRHGEPLLVLDHNGTLNNRKDDRIVRLKTIYDQDGASVPFSYAYSYFEDETTGQIWVGSNGGLFLIDPKEIFDNPTQVRRIKVARNDGTNLADYLLNDVVVNQIIEDGAGNKWFATGGAGLMCTTSDGREILHTYNSDNSPLPGDNVYSICLNPTTNSLMVSTDKGLCELFLSGTMADSDSSVRAYPNPVYPDHYGYVTIDGLASDAMVKIADSAGGVVRELGQASLGRIEWDLTNHNHKRVPGGVYFVVATNGPDQNSYTKMTKILVIE